MVMVSLHDVDMLSALISGFTFFFQSTYQVGTSTFLSPVTLRFFRKNDPHHLSGFVRRILYQFIGPN
jgi:hypothetical protein